MPYMHWRFAGYAALAMSLTFSPQGRADDGPWVGKCVIVKSADVKIRYVDENRREQDDFAPTTAAYTVQQEKGQSVLIRDGGVSGWLAKKDALLAENASEYFTDRIRNNPIDADAYGRRAVARFEAGCLDMVIEDLDDAIRLDPNAAMWRRGRGIVWRLKGDYAKALADLDEAVRLEPKNADPLIERGIVLARKQDYDKALADYDQAIRLDPQYAPACGGRGYVWILKKEHNKALADFDEALRLDPMLSWAYCNRACLLATCSDDKIRDGRKAVESARKACALTDWKEPRYISALAASYAEVGDFDEALKWQKKPRSLSNRTIPSSSPGWSIP